jgi:hypothetical protein
MTSLMGFNSRLRAVWARVRIVLGFIFRAPRKGTNKRIERELSNAATCGTTLATPAAVAQRTIGATVSAAGERQNGQADSYHWRSRIYRVAFSR